MLSSKIESLKKYNNLFNIAQKSSNDFADNLCEFLVTEFDLQAVIIFKIDNKNNLTVFGKSSSAKKSFISDENFYCSECPALKPESKHNTVYLQNNCKLPATDFILYESCSVLDITSQEKVLLKIACKSPITKSDSDNLETIGTMVVNLIRFWVARRGSIDTSLNQLVNEIAHELRTPTNSIMGFASLLNEENLTAAQSEYVNTLKNNALDLLTLLNDLIDIAKINAGLIKENITTVRLKELVTEISRAFEEKLRNKSIEFIINVDKQIPDQIKIDTQKIKYVLLNIINISKRLIDEGKITISITPALQNNITFKISSTGGGIPSNKLKDIFKPFSLNELPNKQTISTSGLGLTLSKKYIELLNGEIEVSSNMGRGTSFIFSIPVELITPIESQISALPKPDGKKNKVLVIEDDYATSKLLSNYLNKWGYEPSIVNSAHQTKQIIEKESFLAILMDIVLPDSSGFELLKELRENKATKYTPVIVCSVETEQQKAFLMGAVEYFVKPIQYKYLVEVLMSYKLKKDSTVLIVDDDVPTLNLIKQAVEQVGVNALAENHSSKVMDLIENKSLDLAIIDLDMPEVNGFELIKMIKLNPHFGKLPVIIYTGKENYQEDLKKIDGLFQELLNKKSTNIEDLAETVNAMINKFDEPPTALELKESKDSVKILLVEDYKHSQIIVTRLLKKNNFESIVVVENGQEAVDEVKNNKYDLILMDMQMPVMNGFEATQRIREMEEYKNTPIIALTAFAMKGDREKCLDAGATDYIPKPIDSQEFIEKVKHYTDVKLKR